jgi:acetylxylan esterase
VTATPTPTTTPVKSTTPVGTSTAPVATATNLPAVGYNQMSNFGTNPNNVGAFSYRPKKLAAKPARALSHIRCAFHN